MAVFFFDSSAIVKLHIGETGTAWTKSIDDPASGNRIYVASIIRSRSCVGNRQAKTFRKHLGG